VKRFVRRSRRPPRTTTRRSSRNALPSWSARCIIKWVLQRDRAEGEEARVEDRCTQPVRLSKRASSRARRALVRAMPAVSALIATLTGDNAPARRSCFAHWKSRFARSSPMPAKRARGCGQGARVQGSALRLQRADRRIRRSGQAGVIDPTKVTARRCRTQPPSRLCCSPRKSHLRDS